MCVGMPQKMTYTWQPVQHFSVHACNFKKKKKKVWRAYITAAAAEGRALLWCDISAQT